MHSSQRAGISATKKRDRGRLEAERIRERAASDEQTLQLHKSEAAGHHGDDPAHGGLATAHLHDRESGHNVVYGHRDETDTKTP